jgi:hypothetical protein
MNARYFTEMPERLLAAAVRHMPAERAEWGAAMLAELAQLQHPVTRWRFALGCSRVALFPPDKNGLLNTFIMKGILATLALAALIGLILGQPEVSGVWLARAFTVYGLVFLLIPAVFFGDLLLLAVVVWVVIGHARGRQVWPKAPALLRRSGRITVEVIFGLLNPVLYLGVFTAALPLHPSSVAGTEWWFAPLTTCAWVLLTAFWMWRLCGAAFDPRARAVRMGLRALLIASLICLLVYTVKDAWLLLEEMERNEAPLSKFLLYVVQLSPLYLIPAVLLWDYLRAIATSVPAHGFFLLTNRASRIAVAGVVVVALVTFALAAHRRSEANVRKLVSEQRAAIQAAATRYDVDPRLISSIVYVTHRDQLSPFRDAIERFFISAWGMNLQRRGPGNERWEEIGTNENPMLNLALDISIGVAQIKPRTALTASVLATGHTPDTLPKPAYYEYRNVEPVGDGWTPTISAQTGMTSPIPVPAQRRAVADMLLDAKLNLETCALILALYQKQWEAANPDWSIRARPDILATLYQIGFARSRPHGAPQSNAFGNRVREVYDQPWLDELFDKAPLRTR